MSGQRRRRRRGPRVFAVLVAVCLVVVGAGYVVRNGLPADCRDSPVAAQAISDLEGYTDWLNRNHVRGYIGEVGWPSGPDSRAWNDVASTWYDVADREGLWVTAWAAGRWWPDSYPMAIYRLTGRDEPPHAGSQAGVVQAHLDKTGTLRGIDLPSGAFAAGPEGPTWYSNDRPGRYGEDYYYDSSADLRQVARTGARIVRLSMTWERLQHGLGAPLDQRELARIRATLQAAQSAGLGVVLDLHGYGDYWVTDTGGHQRLTLGSRSLTDAQFADFWRRLSIALVDSTAVIGYGLMNEPTNLAADPAEGSRRWQSASQAAVQAIRGTGDNRIVFVSGYGGASPSQWLRYHPQSWINDPADQVRYEAHQYFDSDRTGQYLRTFEDETARARAHGFNTVCAAGSSRS
jgi:hypothetical protein